MQSPHEDPCPQRPGDIRNENGDWTSMEMKKMKDPHGTNWYIVHRSANIIKENLTDDVIIRIARDSKAKKIFSAAYWRSADFENGGSYEVRFFMKFQPQLTLLLIAFANRLTLLLLEGGSYQFFF